MLKVAIPNKGQLADPAREMLQEAGYLRNAGVRDLVVQDPANDVEFFFLRPKDVALYVGAGTLDIGITGRDMLLDSGAEATELLPLGFAPSSFRLAAPIGTAKSFADFEGKRIATSYDGLLRSWLAQTGINATVVRLDGAVENAVALGVADAVADVVATTVVRRTGAPMTTPVDTMIRRLQSVMVARTFVLVDYDIKTDNLPAACAITPGIESPTVSPLHESDWSAVRAMVKSSDVHRVMDELYELGARGILVTDIRACRL
jgi:ATP phosphoribosyltransferase